MLDFSFQDIATHCTADQFRSLFFYSQTGQWIPIQHDLVKITFATILQSDVTVNGNTYYTEKYAPLTAAQSQLYFQLLSRFITSVNIIDKIYDEQRIKLTIPSSSQQVNLEAKMEFFQKLCIKLCSPKERSVIKIALKIENFAACLYQEGILEDNLLISDFADRFVLARKHAFKQMLLLACIAGDAVALSNLLASVHYDELLSSITSAELTYTLLSQHKRIPGYQSSVVHDAGVFELLIKHKMIDLNDQSTQQALTQLATQEHSKWHFHKNYRYKPMLSLLLSEYQKQYPNCKLFEPAKITTEHHQLKRCIIL